MTGSKGANAFITAQYGPANLIPALEWHIQMNTPPPGVPLFAYRVGNKHFGLTSKKFLVQYDLDTFQTSFLNKSLIPHWGDNRIAIMLCAPRHSQNAWPLEIGCTFSILALTRTDCAPLHRIFRTSDYICISTIAEMTICSPIAHMP